ncbi:hypothetical protein QQS21_006286 [Conoideocrella luteorostrata]|uniref:Zn(2)-C6 fungal-type domain-containing protein n=1 Tax=Conoideocrella luteorostrata TaxID=1105319 RepID=A0AAJ0FY43_9HYPO|nr:hypothetical protein QQS21_006286 [Conoideocrella luteorostrata]
MAPQMDQESETTGRGPKRRRIALACNACRTRKSRCDGQRPTCSTCSQFNFECQYEPSDSSTNVILRKDYVSDLEERLKVVEGALQRHEDLLTGHLSTCTPSDRHHTNARHGAGSTQRMEKDGGIQVDASSLEDPGADDTPTDGLAMTFVDERSSAFFGQSSNITFVRYLLRAISTAWRTKQGGGLPFTQQEPSWDNHVMEVPGEPSPLGIDTHNHVDVSTSVLPPENEIEELLRIYFGIYGLLFPFTHEPTFWKTYNDFKATGFRKVRRTWLGVLNMMFAMASNVDRDRTSSPKKRFEKAYTFYSRAVALCSAPSRRTINLDIVHYLLLVVLYLQGTQRSIQTWTVHGLLVRTAMALGLHCDDAGPNIDPIEQESRRRTWLTMYCLDKVLSVTFGRPPAMPEEYMTMTMPEPWPLSHTVDVQGNVPATEYATDFLGISARLYRIMGLSVTRQYDSNLGRRDLDQDEIAAIQAAGDMRKELQRWGSELPSYLHLCKAGSPILTQTSTINKLRAILTLRYHNVNILVHRPLLCATLRYLAKYDAMSGEQLPYKAQLTMGEAHECIASAEATITIIHSILMADSTGGNNLGVWFFTLYYAFTASLMVCGRMLWARHAGMQNTDAVVASGRSFLHMATEALEKLDKTNSLVQLCVKYINYLSELQDGPISPLTMRRDASVDGMNGTVQQSVDVSFNGYASSLEDMTDINNFFGSSGSFGTLPEISDASILGFLMPPFDE